MLVHWMVRVILSLLTMPGDSEEEERSLIEHFVVAPVHSEIERSFEPRVS